MRRRLRAPPRSALETAAADVILRDGSTLRLRAPAPEEAGALEAFFAGLSARSFYQRFHGIRTDRRQPGRAPARAGLGRPRRARGRVGRADRRGRGVHAPARRDLGRGGLRGRRRAPGPRDRDAPARAARDPRRGDRDRALRRRGAAGERPDAPGLPRRRLRGGARAGGRRDRGSLPDRRDRDVPRPGRRARPRSGDGVAPPLLRAGLGRRRRGLAQARLDRRRALPQRARGRLPGRGLPGQPGRRGRRRRARLRETGRAARGSGAGSRLPARALRDRERAGGTRARESRPSA